jgi:hypothetical protein
MDGVPGHRYRIVVLARNDEAGRARPSSPRPLVVLEGSGALRQVARNDRVVLRGDQGGQCDPFETEGGDDHMAVKGRYFTIENGVACGQHWTDYVTFRHDPAAGFVFDNERYEAWRLNPDVRPDAEALVRDGPPHVERARPGAPVRLRDWAPSK